ncbi:hypothetical protein [Pseudomonas sp. B21-053]|uniref:hypothetical protein n=1 Tax=Pseudomonas sp. B21-053 TaxID=2895493 RepID=UPI00222F4D75|nr:hypothetical protein [Pseudomonas sp. B21-053]UZE14783.1 hypothetical protein LOY68_14625 [Pseudomonas sp. B21-053]
MNFLNTASSLVSQFFSTGFLAFLLTGLAIFVVRIDVYSERNWVYGLLALLLAILMFAPHGWNVVFPPDIRDWTSLMESRDKPSETSLFKADFFGVLVGAGAAFIGWLMLREKRW